ncbi:PqiC family protein [Paraburkholderia sp. MMS20-SJTN17]|uniref:PqiC family protein n=1 Tax=Paraburkholderia translucens TaxID=2886945 RepID=A0ABS8KEU8_9BURK|nr:PqiC family protein [Paraburkholderia sp. MMS20-SJTN17]MCC8403225.1 PqiC family protein [Paraburkholderia sp. MMS20-SJTN17]
MTRALAFVVIALLVGAVGLAGGCGSSPTSSFYRLKPEATPAATGAAARLNVVVSPVTIPELVDRPQIVVSLADNQVWPNEFQRWAEPLKSNIQRAIAGNLAALLGSERVTVFETGASEKPMWRVRVDVMRFDSMPGDAATIEALWTISPPGSATPVVGHTLAREPVPGQSYDALVAAHDRALAQVSRDIAAAIQNASR